MKNLAQIKDAILARLSMLGVSTKLHQPNRSFGYRPSGVMLSADLLAPPLTAAELAALDGAAGPRVEVVLRARGHRLVEIVAAAWVLPVEGDHMAVVFAEARGKHGLCITAVESDVGMDRAGAQVRIRDWQEALSECAAEAAVS